MQHVYLAGVRSRVFAIYVYIHSIEINVTSKHHHIISWRRVQNRIESCHNRKYLESNDPSCHNMMPNIKCPMYGKHVITLISYSSPWPYTLQGACVAHFSALIHMILCSIKGLNSTHFRLSNLLAHQQNFVWQQSLNQHLLVFPTNPVEKICSSNWIISNLDRG